MLTKHLLNGVVSHTEPIALGLLYQLSGLTVSRSCSVVCVRSASKCSAHNLVSCFCRFEKSESWDLHPKQQHPCYNTSNNDYGAKHPTNFDMPLLWAGIQGKFTGTFHGECYKQMGLKTSVERSRVHRALDYL